MEGVSSDLENTTGISARFSTAIREVAMSQNPGSSVVSVDNDEYRRLEEQHHEYENRLQTLTEKVVLSDEEQLEETTLKKKKLQVKDRMEALVRQARVGSAHP
jgi:uncharacterized protein YdcH (DUF465 family)